MTPSSLLLAQVPRISLGEYTNKGSLVVVALGVCLLVVLVFVNLIRVGRAQQAAQVLAQGFPALRAKSAYRGDASEFWNRPAGTRTSLCIFAVVATSTCYFHWQTWQTYGLTAWSRITFLLFVMVCAAVGIALALRILSLLPVARKIGARAYLKSPMVRYHVARRRVWEPAKSEPDLTTKFLWLPRRIIAIADALSLGTSGSVDSEDKLTATDRTAKGRAALITAYLLWDHNGTRRLGRIAMPLIVAAVYCPILALCGFREALLIWLARAAVFATGVALVSDFVLPVLLGKYKDRHQRCAFVRWLITYLIPVGLLLVWVPLWRVSMQSLASADYPYLMELIQHGAAIVPICCALRLAAKSAPLLTGLHGVEIVFGALILLLRPLFHWARFLVAKWLLTPLAIALSAIIYIALLVLAKGRQERLHEKAGQSVSSGMDQMGSWI